MEVQGLSNLSGSVPDDKESLRGTSCCGVEWIPADRVIDLGKSVLIEDRPAAGRCPQECLGDWGKETLKSVF